MKTKPFQLMLCRTPAFALEDQLSEVWEELKTKIKSSSPTFYKLIADKEQEHIAQLNEKAQFTIWKYFNRAKYRATPFGTFAAFSTLTLTNEPIPLQIERDMFGHQFINWEEKENYIQNTAEVLKHTKFVLCNTTIYEVDNEIRYISFKNGQFQLSSVFSFPELKTILNCCKQKVTLHELYHQLKTIFNLNEKSCSTFLVQLLDLQLIISDRYPNITGTDYFKRINANMLQDTGYVIAERKIKGNFAAQKLKEIPALIQFLANLQVKQAPRDLDEFKVAFLKKYEQRQVPLALAMDPELGIGYGNLAQNCTTNDLLETLRASQSAGIRIAHHMDFTELHAFLLNEIISGGPIQLESFKQENVNAPILPNTFSLLFHSYQDNLVVEHLGGCTANSLIGRFTLASAILEEQGKIIADVENEANPNVVFFDIAYQVEQNVDNVNRRKRLYPKELPILSWSLENDLLKLDDILVSIINDEIVLQSKKLGKRLVPRIPSAYNYTRSDLSLYRFLCDLQHQNICANLQFCLKDYFPKLKHYPRVNFKNIIISPAQWLIPQHLFNQNKDETSTTVLTRLSAWFDKQAIYLPFKAGNGDLTLTFNPTKTDDLLALLNFAKQQNGQDFYLTEALLDQSDCIKDENGKSYHQQYLINYYHREQIYNPIPTLNNTNQQLASDIKFPGGDWLYFEIYCHPQRSDQLLLNQIQSFLKQNKQHLKQWFFIRFDDPSPHLRLRLHVKRPQQIANIMLTFKEVFKPMLLSALITNVEIKTYYRETQRYGASRIDLTEKFFYLDSKQVLQLLRKAKTQDQLYIFALQTMQCLCNTYSNDIKQQIAFITKVATSFANEMEMNADTFKKVNMAFAAFKSHSYLAMSDTAHLNYPMQKLLKIILAKCEHEVGREQLVADLIHMHINRLFFADQRKHETILYHYLLKMLQTKLALSKRLMEYVHLP